MLRKCISCNIGCAGNRIGGNRPIRCTVNPSVLEGDTHLGRKVNKNCNVVVIGGGAVGLDVVEFFAPKGAEVSIVEMMPAIGRDLDPVTKNDTKCMMEKYNVNQLTSTALQEVKEDCFVVKSPEGEVYELPFDHGFVCLGMRAQSKVYEEVSKAYKDTNDRVENIGDSVRARRIIDGTFEGRNIVFTLEQKGFL